MTTVDHGLARRMWHQLEPIHAVFWYAPEVSGAAAALGYDVATRWPSYFAWRGAPLGAAGPTLVASAFYSFSPDMVAQHVPAAWTVASPAQVLAGRTGAVDRLYRALFSERIGSSALAEAASLAREAALAAGTAGRTLTAANAKLPWPDEPHLVLWHAIPVGRSGFPPAPAAVGGPAPGGRGPRHGRLQPAGYRRPGLKQHGCSIVAVLAASMFH